MVVELRGPVDVTVALGSRPDVRSTSISEIQPLAVSNSSGIRDLIAFLKARGVDAADVGRGG